MSIEYGAEIGIGYKLDEGDLYNFIEEIRISEDTVTYEDRYCPKTGKKLPTQEKIVKRGLTELKFILDGRDIEENDLWGPGLANAIAEHLGCEVWSGNEIYIFGVDIPIAEEGGDFGFKFSFGPSYWLKDVIKSEESLKEVAVKLKKYGIKPGKPMVYNLASVW